MKKLLLVMFTLLIATTGYCADEWDKSVPADGDAKVDYPTDQGAILEATDRLLSNYREGMKLKYTSATTVTVAKGEIVCSNGAGTVRHFRANTSTTAVTFANIDTGAEANNTYYVYAVADADATTATFSISLSSTVPSGATYYKRLGSFVNSGGDMEQIANDNDSVIVATGTIANGATISLPAGFLQDECNWMVGLGSSGVPSTGAFNDLEVIVSSSRVSTCVWSSDTAAGGTCTANYTITCHR